MKMKANKIILIVLLIIFISIKDSYSQTIGEILSSSESSISASINLSSNEKKALQIVNEWTKGNRVSPITKGNNGEIEMIYGLSQPHILTAILQVTDIQFEQGETITSIHLGDTARWSMEHIKANTIYGYQDHIIVKPKDINLLTSLVVVTDKRTYHLQLKSTERQYYPMVKFHYPSSLIVRSNREEMTVKTKEISMKDITTGSYLKDLSFGYTIKGNAKFKPVRVYNDGLKTIVELPRTINSSNIPILMTLEPESKKPVIVNYRYQNNFYLCFQRSPQKQFFICFVTNLLPAIRKAGFLFLIFNLLQKFIILCE